MANEENLKPFNELTENEQREIASKGGKASAVARRKKANLKQAFETLLTLSVVDEDVLEELRINGLGATNEEWLALATFQHAINGNQKAMENILKLTNAKDKHDIAEQKARTKLLNLQIKEQEQANKASTEPIIIVDEWSENKDV